MVMVEEYGMGSTKNIPKETIVFRLECVMRKEQQNRNQTGNMEAWCCKTRNRCCLAMWCFLGPLPNYGVANFFLAKRTLNIWNFGLIDFLSLFASFWSLFVNMSLPPHLALFETQKMIIGVSL